MPDAQQRIIPRLDLLAEGESPDLLTSLALTSQIHGQGPRPSEGQRYEYLRDLTPADLALLKSAEDHNVLSVVAAPISHLSHRHHLCARMIADGAKLVDVSYATGFSPSRLSQLKVDRDFGELIDYYAQRSEKVYLDVHQRIGNVGMMALDRLAERLGDDDQARLMSNKTLMDVAAMALDRSIAPLKRAAAAQLSLTSQGANGSPGLSININFGDAPDVPPVQGNGGNVLDLTPNEQPTSEPVDD